MPQELVDMVVKEALQPARDEACKHWDTIFACVEERCKYHHLYSEKQKEELRPVMKCLWQHGVAGGVDFSLDDVLSEYADESGGDILYDLHWDNKSLWQQAVSQGHHQWNGAGKFKHYPGDFDKYAKVLHEDSGLSACISHQKITSTLSTIFPSPGTLMQGGERETTIAFLILPASITRNMHQSTPRRTSTRLTASGPILATLLCRCQWIRKLSKSIRSNAVALREQQKLLAWSPSSIPLS